MIEASTVGVKTMADSTLRLTIDIEPRHAQEAFSLFGSRGVPCVIARLTMEHERAPEKPKGGPLAKLAGQLCADPEFREWIGVEDDGIGAEEAAARVVRFACVVQSRAELDHNAEAARKFHEQFRMPWAQHCKGRTE